MSSSNGTPPTGANDTSFASVHANGLDAAEKPRLTEEEKKQNHIASGTSQLDSPLLFPLRHVLIIVQSKNDGKPSAKALIGYASSCPGWMAWAGPRASCCSGRWSL